MIERPRLLPLLTLLPALLLPGLPKAEAQTAASLCADNHQASRQGNDDLFIFVDSSLSMGPRSFGPWARGTMAPVREVLLRLVDCYVEEGDYVLLATFDSEARIEAALEIRQPERDILALREQVANLAPSRPRYWRLLQGGERGAELAPIPQSIASAPVLRGGSLHTDLGKLSDFVIRVLPRYRDPAHRQVVLLFTDGEHDPPEDSHHHGQDVALGTLFERPELQDHRIGLVALPGSEGRLQPALRQLVHDAERNPGGTLVPLVLGQAPDVSALYAKITDLLNTRLDLVSPQLIDLEPAYQPRMEQEFTVANPSSVPRTLLIQEVLLKSDHLPAPIQLTATPSQLILAGGEQQTLTVRGPIPSLPSGPFVGELTFKFSGALSFQPKNVPVRGERLSWLRAYGGWLLAILLALAALATLWLLRRLRPVYAVLVWSDATGKQVSPVKPLRVRRKLAFGTLGEAGLHVEGPGRVLGRLHRPGLATDLLRLEWSLSVGGGEQTVGSGQPIAVPDRPEQRVTLHWYARRSEANNLAKALGGGR